MAIHILLHGKNISMKIKKIINLTRDKVTLKSRKGYLRLDKNERVSSFKNFLLKKIQLNSFDLTSYPETGSIYKNLAIQYKLSINNFILTAGSEFGLRLCFQYFCNKKKSKVITLNPTFGMVDVYSKLFEVNQIKINYNKKLELEIDKFIYCIKPNISLIIIANPNSPTGTIIEKKIITKILSKAKKNNIPVLIDEAYAGFYNYSFINLITKFNNLIILRTFSKSFGLAGLRVGFLAANKKIIKEIYKYKPMYEINSAATKAVLFFQKNKRIVKQYLKDTQKGKSFFEKKCTEMKIKYLKTFANFIHIKLGKKKKKIERQLYKSKILTRKGPGVKGLEDYLRVTLGPVNEMKKIISVLQKFY